MVRLLHAIEKELGHLVSDIEVFRRTSDFYHSGAAALLQAPRDLKARREVIERSLGHATALLGKGLKQETLLAQTLDVVVSLESEGANGGWRMEYFWHLLEQWKVFTSDLERYLITSVFIYPSLMPIHRRCPE
jgi:hypothetical protein